MVLNRRIPALAFITQKKTERNVEGVEEEKNQTRTCKGKGKGTTRLISAGQECAVHALL